MSKPRSRIPEVALSILLWCLFALGWVRVLPYSSRSEVLSSLRFMGAAAAAYGMAIGLFVFRRTRQPRLAEQGRDPLDLEPSPSRSPAGARPSPLNRGPR